MCPVTAAHLASIQDFPIVHIPLNHISDRARGILLDIRRRQRLQEVRILQLLDKHPKQNVSHCLLLARFLICYLPDAASANILLFRHSFQKYTPEFCIPYCCDFAGHALFIVEISRNHRWNQNCVPYFDSLEVYFTLIF
jgi:hypothetical protein